MGIGFGEGANRAVDAARQAISNPLLESASIDGAKSVLVNLAGGDSLTLQEYQDVVELVTENCSDDALIIAGQAYNPELGDQIKVTVVATGFERKSEQVGVENADMEMIKRRFSTPQTQQEREHAHETEQPSIEVNRWQDLQKQLGRGTSANSGDYTIPTVLRYSRGQDEEGR